MFKFTFLFLLLFSVTKAQEADSLSVTKAAILGAGTLGGIALSYNFQSNEYWNDPAPWHLVSWRLEYDDALLADKLGHFYFSYALANSFSKVTEWSGLNREAGAWVGFGVSMLHQTAVEIYDGYSDGRTYLGFSRGDMIANILGASYSVGQYYYPYLNNINPKISYYPYSTDEYNTVFNDYNATNHWVSLDVWSMANSLDKDWYKAFGLAIGHSVTGINRNGSGQHQFYLGLDANWNYLKQFDFVKNSYYLQLIINVLEKYKVPLPAIRFGTNVRGFLVR